MSTVKPRLSSARGRSSRIREASSDTRPDSEQNRRGAATASSGAAPCSRRISTCRMDGAMRSLPGEPMTSHGLRPRKTMVGATLAHGAAFGRM